MHIVFLRRLLLILTAVLCGVGLMMVLTSTATKSSGTDLNFGFLIKQIVAMAVGWSAFIFVRKINLDKLHGRSWFSYLAIIGIVALLLYTIFFGKQIKGATRWIDLGFFNLQTAELAKLLIIPLAAWYFSRQAENVSLYWRGIFVPMIVFVLLAVLIYMTKDLGSVIVMFGILFTMIVFAEAPWFQLVIQGIVFAPLFLYFTVFKESFRYERMLAFVNPWESTASAADQLRQAYIALGSGGIYGYGMGGGLTNNERLPERHTDFIYAVIGEKFGMIGCVAVLVLYFFLVAIGLFIAMNAKQKYQRLLAIGATMLIGIQAFWNMLVVTGSVPTKGLTLPFISYGGTSMVVSLTAIGIISAVAKSCEKHALAHSGVTSSSLLGAVTVKINKKKSKAVV